ncbi:MAG: Membrane fusogenic [Pseudomonadota bacterium]|jgi:BMFP domain-containing protein YqiC
MNNDNLINTVSEEIQRLIFPFLRDASEEMRQHIQQLIKNTLERQGIVTREMFDVQTALLSKARIKLDNLELALKQHLDTVKDV